MNIALKENVSFDGLVSLINRFDCLIVLCDGPESSVVLQRDALRLSAVLPVISVSRPGGTTLDATPIYPGIEHFVGEMPQDSATFTAFQTFLEKRGIARPILWMAESGTYEQVLDAWPNALRVVRALENAPAYNAESVLPIKFADIFVADTEAVAARIRLNYGDRIPVVVVRDDGDDAEVHSSLTSPIALVDTGIGVPPDPALLDQLARRMPGWEFHLAARGERAEPNWQLLESYANVHRWGVLDEHEYAGLVKSATAALFPSKESAGVEALERMRRLIDWGLPVVAAPTSDSAVAVSPASSLDAFADALRRCRAFANLRSPLGAQAWLGRLAHVLNTRVQEMLAAPVRGRLNILMLYDDRSTFSNTIREHLESFAAYSRHSFHYMAATGAPMPMSAELDIDLSIFDAIVCHYSVRLSVPDHLQMRIAEKLTNFQGLKILFIQDEYDATETARAWMERLGFHVVYTCVPPNGREYVYPASRLPRVEFLPTLTGYVPIDEHIDGYALPIEARTTRIAYRGRMLPYHYGTLGWEKYRIGVDVKRMAEEREVCVDIEVDDTKRIYGADWYRFLGSARATLGTESGSNAFDFDGTLRSRIGAFLAVEPDASFETIRTNLLAPLEACIRMNQISPKIFEAARLRTALILFEGEYSGVVRPYEHYLPLRRDYSNLDEILAALEDIPRLREMTDRTYRDLIASGQYSYQVFVEAIDADIENRLLRGPRCRIFAVPALVRDVRGTISRLHPDQSAAWYLFNEVLTTSLTREQVSELVALDVPALADVSAVSDLQNTPDKTDEPELSDVGAMPNSSWKARMRRLARRVANQIMG